MSQAISKAYTHACRYLVNGRTPKEGANASACLSERVLSIDLRTHAMPSTTKTKTERKKWDPDPVTRSCGLQKRLHAMFARIFEVADVELVITCCSQIRNMRF